MLYVHNQRIRIDSIERIERLLRLLIHEELSSAYGANWTETEELTPRPGWHKSLLKKREKESKKLKHKILYNIPIEYAEFSDLGKIIETNKKLFEKVFGDYERFIQYYKAVEELRNTVKHHRDIKPHQRYLLEGIAGEFDDLMTFRRIGSRIEINSTLYQFKEFIKTTGKNEKKILEDTKNSISGWSNKVANYLESRKKLNIISDFEITKRDFECYLKTIDFELKILVADDPLSNNTINGINYKSYGIDISIGKNCSVNIGDFLNYIDKPYEHISYQLNNKINVERLLELGQNAGLPLKEAAKRDNELVDIDCCALNGKLHLGARKYAHANTQRGSEIFATSRNQRLFWGFHKYIQANELIGFMIGDISPRNMLHLLQLSQDKNQLSRS